MIFLMYFKYTFIQFTFTSDARLNKLLFTSKKYIFKY